MTSKRLEGRTGLVTGAGGGVGRGIALELARAGCCVAVNDIRAADAAAAATVDEIKAIGGEAFAVLGSVADATDVNTMVAAVLARCPRLDILVNNAGVQTWKPFLDVTEEEWDLVIDTNLKGCFLASQAAARHMKEHGGGAIVNIGSGCNKVAFPNLVAYTASKGGIEMLTKVSALELGRYGIRVNCVAPGSIDIERTRLEASNLQVWVSSPRSDESARRPTSARPSFTWRGRSRLSEAARRGGSTAAGLPRGHGRRTPMSMTSLWVDSRCVLGEGILWSARRRALLWTDIEGATIWQAPHPDGEPVTRPQRDRVGSMAECESGEFLLGFTKKICRVAWSDSHQGEAVLTEVEPGVPHPHQ